MPDPKEKPIVETYTTEEYVQMAVEAEAAWEGDNPTTVALDTETSGVTHFDTSFCATVSWRDTPDTFSSHYLDLRSWEAVSFLRELFDLTPQIVFWNMKFDLQKLLLEEVIDWGFLKSTDGLIDAHTMAHLLDERWPARLKDFAVEVLGIDDTIEVPLKSDPTRTRFISEQEYEMEKARKLMGVKKKDGYAVLPRNIVREYALRDTEITLEAYEYLKGEWERRIPDDSPLWSLLEREHRVSFTLLRMQERGMRIDVPYVTETLKRLNSEVASLEMFVLKESGREEFSQYHEWIKEILEERGHTVPNTQRATLEQVDDEVAQALVERGKKKKLADYFVQILSEQRDGVLHPPVRQHGTVSGRTSGGEAETE